MRQHKYRFWDGKTMIYHGYRHADLSFHGLLVCEGDTIPLEWTGLHDKNGKEIYEGDVVAHTFTMRMTRGPDTHHVQKKTVEWSGNSYWGVEEPFDVDRGSWSIEVIGNIYENPELLEEK